MQNPFTNHPRVFVALLIVVLAGCLVWFFWPDAQPGPLNSRTAVKQQRQQASEGRAQGQAYTDSILEGHSQLMRTSQGRQQAERTYNQAIIRSRTENETLRRLPAAARRSADLDLLRNYPGPEPCPYCDSLLR